MDQITQTPEGDIEVRFTQGSSSSRPNLLSRSSSVRSFPPYKISFPRSSISEREKDSRWETIPENIHRTLPTHQNSNLPMDFFPSHVETIHISRNQVPHEVPSNTTDPRSAQEDSTASEMDFRI